MIPVTNLLEQNPDVLVIGVGMAGLSAAAELQRAGRRVQSALRLAEEVSAIRGQREVVQRCLPRRSGGRTSSITTGLTAGN